MITTTTHNIEGRRITDYIGIVSGETVVGTNIFRDIMAGITDIIGGRSAGYEKELRQAKELAIEKLEHEARTLGANAVVGVDLDYESIGGGGKSMLMVTASGTAVKVE